MDYDERLWREMLANRVNRDFDKLKNVSMSIAGQPSKDEIGGTEYFQLSKRHDGKFNLYWGNQFRPRGRFIGYTLEQVKERVMTICMKLASLEYCKVFLRQYDRFNY